MKNSYHTNKKIAQELVDILSNKSDQRSECVDQWMESNPSARETLSNFTDEKRLADNLEHFYQKSKFTQTQRLHNSIHKKRRITRINRMSAVAAVLASVSLLLWWGTNEKQETVVVQTEVPQPSKIAINTPNATPILLLQNGNRIALSNEIGGNFEKVYEEKQLRDSIITIVVPAASDFKFSLSDGTVVRLNAKSKLIFPKEFSEEERRVEIDGEGFFEVVKGESPFIVKVNKMEIKVYGTKFNVNSYDHNAIETFLLEGSVGISTPSNPNEKEVKLKTNDLSVTDHRGKSVVSVVDPNRYIAWTRGFFLFDESPVSKILEELERRYDVEFIVKCDPKKLEEKVVASFNRDVNIERILTMMNKTIGFKFSQAERRIIIE